ncbi:MAG: Rossmann-like and DUF2520 domain-containing protein [Bacteroidota bacterium]
MAYRISIIGSGNVAWHLAPALENAGYGVFEVYGRSPKRVKELVSRLYEAEVKKDLNFSISKSDVFIIATSDDAVEEIAQEISLPNEDSILVHTSGSLSAGILSYAATQHIGIFYPIQSLTRNKPMNFDEIPICIEGESTLCRGVLKELGNAISRKVVSINSDQRLALHLAAVFANNFVNHFLGVSNDILKENKLDQDLLYPLVKETLEKTAEIDPKDAQTGPAKRHDFETLDRHLEYLKKNEELAEVYRIVSQHIVDSHPLE